MCSVRRRHDGLLGQRVLLPFKLRRPHHVPGKQRPRGGPPAETTAFGDRLLLPARQVPHRGELGAVVRPHGRVHRKVSGPAHTPTPCVECSACTSAPSPRAHRHADRAGRAAAARWSEMAGLSLAACSLGHRTPLRSRVPTPPPLLPPRRGACRSLSSSLRPMADFS